MAYVITICLSVISTVLAFIITSLLRENHNLKEKEKTEAEIRENAIRNALICLLRVKLIE